MALWYNYVCKLKLTCLSKMYRKIGAEIKILYINTLKMQKFPIIVLVKIT